MKLAPVARPAPAADMLPILNIVLLLLAFFLMLVRMAPAASLALPRSTTGAAATTARLVVVHADGSVMLDGQAVADAELVARLHAAHAPLLQLQAHPQTLAVRVLQLAQLAGSVPGTRVQLLVAGDGR